MNQFASAYLATRRQFLASAQGIGALALGELLGREGHAATQDVPRLPGEPKAKRVIYLHMAGSPPQHELFDYKPYLKEHHLEPCPEELLKGQRFAFIKGRPQLLGCPHEFHQHGESGNWFSELLPKLATHSDRLCFIKSMWTDQFNHAPAQMLLYTGASRFGGASMGSWITYGLGSDSQDLPGFVVLISGGTDPSGGKSLWGSGFLPSVYQGVQCRTTGDPILFVSNPPGMSRDLRRRSLDTLKQLNELELSAMGDPETRTRIDQYELAFRMQMSVPNVMDITQEPKAIQDMYGIAPGQESFANNCLLARRLVERGVRYVQLFDYGWDFHGTSKGNDIVYGLPDKCKLVDQPLSALLTDLDQRGLLEETLVVWSGEFGRTSMNEARNGSKFLGRDHHPHCFTVWLAGGGIKPGYTHGATDELGYFITEGKTSVHDLQATILHQLGIDPFRFSVPYQGLDQRLIGPTEDPRIVREILA